MSSRPDYVWEQEESDGAAEVGSPVLCVFLTGETERRGNGRDGVSGYSDGTENLSRPVGIDTHAASTRIAHEHSRGPRSKVCVNLCMGELPPPTSFSVFCVQVSVETLSSRGVGLGVDLPAKTQSVNYLLIQFGR